MPNTHFGPDFLKAKAAQRVVHLGSLHFKAKPQEIEAAAQAMLPGAQCAFYWLALPADYSGEHKGWCEVAFEDVDMANRALAAWTSLKIRGRLVKAQRPRTTGSHTSPVSSVRK